MKQVEYRVSLTTFDPVVKTEHQVCEEPSRVAALVAGLPLQDVVVVVEAVNENIDYGNFYFFMNANGVAHVMLHEHREFILAEKAQEAAADTVTFKDEDGSAFSVEGALTTSVARARIALEYWLPSQAQSPEFTWQ